jgi:hypothetical protein
MSETFRCIGTLYQCSGFVTFWSISGSADPYLWLTDPDPALFVSNLPDTNKKITDIISSKIKSHKEVTKGFSNYFCLMMEGSGAGSVPPTNGSGSGSGRPKNLRILRIRIRLRLRNTVYGIYHNLLQKSTKVFIKITKNKKKLSPQNVLTPVPSVVQV